MFGSFVRDKNATYNTRRTKRVEIKAPRLKNAWCYCSSTLGSEGFCTPTDLRHSTQVAGTPMTTTETLENLLEQPG